jgi:hypothetical protein
VTEQLVPVMLITEPRAQPCCTGEGRPTRGVAMAGEPLQFEAELTVRDHMRARAEHPATADKVFLMDHGRHRTYREFRDDAARIGHFLLGRLLGR